MQRSPLLGTTGRASPARQPAVALPPLSFPRPLCLMLRCCNLCHKVKMNFLKLPVTVLVPALGKDENKLWYWGGCCILCSCIPISSDRVAAAQ